jgi:transposase InsO family protein
MGCQACYRVELLQPGNPQQNAYVERFNGSMNCCLGPSRPSSRPSTRQLHNSLPHHERASPTVVKDGNGRMFTFRLHLLDYRNCGRICPDDRIHRRLYAATLSTSIWSSRFSPRTGHQARPDCLDPTKALLYELALLLPRASMAMRLSSKPANWFHW